MYSAPDRTANRQACLSVMLATLFAVFLMFMAFLVTGGAIIYVLPVIIGLGLFGWMHYLLWGKAMNEETAEERETEQLWQEIQRDDWAQPDPDRWFERN